MDQMNPPHSFRSGSTARNGSFLHPCARPKYRIASVLHALHHAHLGQNKSSARASTGASSQIQQFLIGTSDETQDCHLEALYRSSFGPRAGPAVSTHAFYQAFNSLQLQLYKAKLVAGVRIRNRRPLPFDLEGNLLPNPQRPRRPRRTVSLSTSPTMPSSCQDIRAALAACLQSSDCIMIDRNKPADCLRPPLLETLPTKCQQLKKGYGECKRGMVDMRKRFRGNQPLAIAKEGEGGSGSKHSGQLYGGKPAFEPTAHKTDGREEVVDWREAENEKFRKS